MLKSYSNQTDIPEALREFYSKREDGKWHADIPDDHPAVKHNAKLLSEKQTAEGKVTQLESDLESAKASSLPRGHVAVARADAELIERYKPLGTPDEITAMKTEHGTLKQDAEKRAREDNLRLVAKELNYQPDAFILLPNLPEFEIRDGKDGKKTVIAKLKDDKGVVTEKPANEFIESSPSITPLLPALKASEGVRVHTTAAGAGSQGVDPYAWARDFGKQWNEQNKPAGDVMADFGMAKSA